MTRRRAPWLFLAPHLTLFTIATVLPLLAAFSISLYDWNLLGDRRWIGLENFRELLEDPQFYQALAATAKFAAVIVPGSLAGGLALALALNQPWPGRALLRGAFYIPGVLSGVAAGLVMAWIFNDHFGVLNAVLERAGLPRVPWLSAPGWAIAAVAATVLWVRIGFCMVIYLAGLQAIPQELYEAARMDGAGPWARFRHVTWPGLRRVTLFLLIMNMLFALQSFDAAYAMTQGGPAFATTLLVHYLYETGFAIQRQGYAAALGVVLYGLTLVLTLLLWRVQSRGQE